MAGKTTSKFVYEIQASYGGQSALQKLQQDLNAIGKIDAYKKAISDWQELNRQFVDAKAKLREVQAEMRGGGGDAGTRSRYANLANDVKLLSRALDGQRQKMQSAGRDLQSVGIAAKDAASKYKELQRVVQQQGRGIAARNTLGIRSDADIKQEIEKLRRAYRDLQRSGTASLSELHRAHQSMRSRIQQLTSDTNGWTNATGRLRDGFAKVVIGIGALRFGRAALDSLTQYDDAMRRVNAISGATREEFSALDATAQRLAASTRFSAVEIARAMQQLAAAGQSAGQIQSSIQAVMDVAAIAQMDVGEAADQVTNIMTQFGIEASKSASVADALVAGFTGSATSMDQLANAMTYAGPVAHALGYELEDTTAVLMALANAGYKSERAGTSLRGGLTRLIRPMRMGREVIKKYGLEFFDAEGKMRDFADVLDDIARAGLHPAEMIKLFGQEAGPGMIALLGQGGDAIRKYRAEIDAAGGKARELAEEMENGIGGAQRRLQAATDSMLRSFAAASEPVLRPMIEALAEFAGKIANISPETKQAALAITTMLAILTALGGALKMLQMAQFVFTLGGLSSACSAAAGGAATFGASVAAAGLVLKTTFVGVVLAATLAVAKLAHTIYEWRQAEAEAQASIERGKQLREDLAKRYEEISKQTGLTIKNHQQLARALDEGKIHFDEATKTYKKGAGERQQASKQTAEVAKQAIKVEGDALKELVEQYKQTVSEIIRIQEEIAGRHRSLAAELRDMGRSGMSERDAWADQKREAEEYMAAARRVAEEAKKAMAAGDTLSAGQRWKEATQYADDAKNAYKALNKEVKDGDQVIKSKGDALKEAMAGVREAGELGIEILQQQQEEARKTLQELEKESGGAGLIAHLEQAQQKWLESWGRMGDVARETVHKVGEEIEAELDPEEIADEWGETFSRFERDGEEAAEEVGRALDEATKPRTVKIYTETIQRRRWGGLVLRYADAVEQHLKRGGKLPGYGGGDKVSAMLEPGEFVVRKESVRHFGADFFETLNNLKLPDLSSLLPALPKPSLAAAGPASPTRTVNINLNVGGETYQMQTDERTAARLERWYALRSSNRLTRADFRG